ncbi:UNVERIFIED_CONTAM: hypothetical protein Scaly_0531600 [Sesamum calycinum]|uniref:Uncharacterized protein n=1 Tax=Sesamum calycinum TaxID=2727403 RepID=A0AAW2RSG3_9LAMI
MDEKGVFEEDIDRLYPMFFGVSCAFFALRLLPEPEICDGKWSEIRNRMLKGSAHLLGLLIWRVQKEVANSERFELLHKIEMAQKEIAELKRIRSEDAKANERVVSMFAAREQSWFDERKKLRQQIGALMNDLRVLEMKKEKTIAELGEKLKEAEVILQSKDELIEEGEKTRRETEEKLQKAETLAEELTGTVKSEAQRHSSEISKHKTAFIELVSNQRQLEAEMGRAVRQLEAAKEELDLVLEQKEELVLVNQRLSMELVKMHKDLEQKDQILSAMLRKSKLDTAEKEMLLKEVKLSKAKRKQAELETARWKAVSESKHEKHSSRSMLSKHVKATQDMFSGGKTVNGYHLENEQLEIRKELEVFSQEIEQRHHLEIDAFAEQLRVKDEKLEAFRWRLMSMELESKRFQSHIEGLNHEIAQLRQENMKLEGKLLDREAELHSLKEQLEFHSSCQNQQKQSFNSSRHDAAVGHNAVWSKVKVIKRKPGRKKQETKVIAEGVSQEVDNDNVDGTSANEELHDIVLTLESSNKEIKEGKVSVSGTGPLQHANIYLEGVKNAETSTSGKRSNSTWTMDVHALGISYKIKRLKQQLLLLERLTGKKESCEDNDQKNAYFGWKGFNAVMSILNKQVDRYQNLQGKIDDLCKRMAIALQPAYPCCCMKLQHGNNPNSNCGGSTIARPEDGTKTLEQFLEETFQLQRYIVATGQKLIEVQAKIVSGFLGNTEDIEMPESFDMNRYADIIKTLFREVQRGLEVRISRLIGDLEGTLAFDGFHTSQKNLPKLMENKLGELMNKLSVKYNPMVGDERVAAVWSACQLNLRFRPFLR